MSSLLQSTYRHSLREAIVILLAWLLCLVYTTAFCYMRGYSAHQYRVAQKYHVDDMVGPLDNWNRTPESLATPGGLGIPDWVLWGVIVPWGLCILFTIWFCLFFFREDELGDNVA
ncbi:MAG: hypothetical protein KDA60_06475 [Planctomycetales bacterium]|nr:hypothetical protein [Planctomycetales bacterium]